MEIELVEVGKVEKKKLQELTLSQTVWALSDLSVAFIEVRPSHCKQSITRSPLKNPLRFRIVRKRHAQGTTPVAEPVPVCLCNLQARFGKRIAGRYMSQAQATCG